MNRINRRIATVLAVSALFGATQSATAATASFVSAGSSVFAGTPIEVDVSVSRDTLDSFDYAFIVIGSDDVADITFDGFDSEWTTAFQDTLGPDDEDSGEGSYDQEIDFGGDNNGTQIAAMTLTAATLIIDTTAMAPGDYSLSIDGDYDGVSKLVMSGETDISEDIFGQFDFTVLPEPASLLLLAAGFLTISRRTRCPSRPHRT